MQHGARLQSALQHTYQAKWNWALQKGAQLDGRPLQGAHSGGLQVVFLSLPPWRLKFLGLRFQAVDGLSNYTDAIDTHSNVHLQGPSEEDDEVQQDHL